ncbi:MAG: hypothetical protein O2968_08380 [Acidobacteria bacterium]|nr:hypothetical protein [Acidobacteriota bacterium]
MRVLVTIAVLTAGFVALPPQARAQLKEREQAPLELPANMRDEAALPPQAGPQLKEREQAPLELPANMRDEDEDRLADPDYVFNPIQARRDVKIGDFYAKKGSQRAAAGRYLEATRWDPGFSEAYWKLARIREKLEQHQQAVDAYKVFVKLEPGDKRAKEALKRLPGLEKKAAEVPDPPDEARPDFVDSKIPRTF